MSGTTVTSTLVWNEQTKLVANALDRASTAIGVGSLFPLWQLYKGGAAHVLPFAASAYIFIFGATAATFAGSTSSPRAQMMDMMTGFLFFGFPGSVVLLGWAAVKLHERAAPKEMSPGKAEKQRPGTSLRDNVSASIMHGRPPYTFGLGTGMISPSAYTYFGQFVDHDITFEPSAALGRPNRLQG
jgi:hypothetical protein